MAKVKKRKEHHNKAGKVISKKKRIFVGNNLPKAKELAVPRSSLSKKEIVEIQKGVREGNQWWKMRTTHGRDKIFGDPEIMWQAACEYFQFTDNRPWKKRDWKSDKELGLVLTEVPIDTPYTMSGLSVFWGVSEDYIYSFKHELAEKDDEMSQDFSRVLSLIEKVMRTQKFEGAATGAYKENIIAYDLGYKKDAMIINNAQANSVNIEVKEESKKNLLSDVIAKLEAIDIESDKVD